MTAALGKWPRGHYWTADDLDDLPEGRFEIVEGNLLMMASPSARHQRILLLLAQAIEQQLPEALYCVTEVDLVLRPELTREPDLVVVSEEHVEESRFASDDVRLVVEVVSPDSPYTDRNTKPDEYAAAGIPAYWLVETHPAIAIVEHRLVGNRYVAADPAIHVFETEFPWPIRVGISDLNPRRRLGS